MNTRFHNIVKISVAVVALAAGLAAAVSPAQAAPLDGPIRPAGKPDLVVENGSAGFMWITEYVGSGISVRYWGKGVSVTVHNAGNAYSTASWAGVHIETIDSLGIFRSYDTCLLMPGLAPGASATTVVAWGFAGCTISFSATADVFQYVWESNETNNSLTYNTICDPSIVSL